MATDNVETGEVEVLGQKIEITTFTGGNPQNIYHLVQGFDIYESVEMNCITADFFVMDGIELLNYLPAGGEEFISLSIRTPQRKTCKYKFFVHSIVGLRTTDDGQFKSYQLKCVSEDYLKNSHTRITKRYKDLDYQDAINELFTTDFPLTKGPPEVEPTKGKFDYVVNHSRPFQIADLLCDRAVSSKYKGTDFLFYEDNEKFRFLTYEYLIETRKGKAKGFTFVYDTSNKYYPVGDYINVRNILAYEVMTQGNSVEKIKQGAQRLSVREFDLLHGDYFKKNEYVNSSDYKKFKETDKKIDVNSAAYSSSVESMPAQHLMAIKDGLRPDMKHNDFIHFKRAWQVKGLQFGMRLRVYGDTSLLIGDLIECKFPEVSLTTSGRQDQQVYSGNYFVKDIRHTCTKRSDGLFEHFMNLDIRRPNLKKALG